jgi:hypothetical protein
LDEDEVNHPIKDGWFVAIEEVDALVAAQKSKGKVLRPYLTFLGALQIS